MDNNLIFSNSNIKSPNILDFLDNVKKHKASNDGGSFDIVDIVKAFYGLNDDKINPTMSKSVKKQEQAEPLNLLTLSRMSTMSKDLESEIEKYQYLYDERAAIYEFEAGYSTQETEQKALNDTSIIYAEDNGLNPNSEQVINFINQLIIN